MMPRLTSGLKADSPGLVEVTERLAANRQSSRLALVVVDLAKSETNLDTGQVTLTARIRRIEDVPTDWLAGAVSALRDAAWERHRKALSQHMRDESERPEPLFPEGTTLDLLTGEILPPRDETAPPDLFNQDRAPADDPSVVTFTNDDFAQVHLLFEQEAQAEADQKEDEGEDLDVGGADIATGELPDVDDLEDLDVDGDVS